MKYQVHIIMTSTIDYLSWIAIAISYVVVVIVITGLITSSIRKKTGRVVSFTSILVYNLFLLAARTTAIAHAFNSYILCYREVRDEEDRKSLRYRSPTKESTEPVLINQGR